MDIVYYLVMLAILSVGAWQDLIKRHVLDWVVIAAWFVAYLSNPDGLRLAFFAFPFLWGLTIVIGSKRRILARWGDITFAPILIIFIAELLGPLGMFASIIYAMMGVIAILARPISSWLCARLGVEDKKDYPGFLLFLMIYITAFSFYLFCRLIT
jgi:hypothetical protein